MSIMVIGLALMSIKNIVNGSSEHVDVSTTTDQSFDITVKIHNSTGAIIHEYGITVHPMDTIISLRTEAYMETKIKLDQYTAHLFPNLEKILPNTLRLGQLYNESESKTKGELQIHFMYRPNTAKIHSLSVNAGSRSSPAISEISLPVSPLTSVSQSQNVPDLSETNLDESRSLSHSPDPSRMFRVITDPQSVQLFGAKRIITSHSSSVHPKRDVHESISAKLDSLASRIDQMEKRMNQFDQVNSRILKELDSMNNVINMALKLKECDSNKA